MKVEVRAEARTPAGRHVSYTQLSQNCDLKLKFHRARVRQKHVGVAAIYGSAFHAGVEAFLKGKAKTPAEAVKAAKGYLANEMISENRLTIPIRWDEYHEVNLDGTVSGSPTGNFARLSAPEFCNFWLERQLPVWIALYGGLKVKASEHRIDVKLTKQEKWSGEWSIECWLDFEVEGEARIIDLKSAASPWDEKDVHEKAIQANLYMGAYQQHYDVDPTTFDFHVLPRTKAALAEFELIGLWTTTDAKVLKKEGWPSPHDVELAAVQVHAIPFDPDRTNTYVKGVIRPKIALIEAEAFVANPTGWWCSNRYCGYFDHCAFGNGENL